MFTALCVAKLHLQRTLDGRKLSWSSCTVHSDGFKQRFQITLVVTSTVVTLPYLTGFDGCV